MNIGIVTTWFERGASYVSRAYMDTLSKYHNVFVYARGGEKYAVGDARWDLPNVTWNRPNYIPYPTRVNFSRFLKWLSRNKIDVIIFNEQRSWDVILKLRNTKYVIGAYIDYYTPTTVPFFKFYDFLLCNTNRHFEVFKDHPQSFYIPWGTDTNICSPSPKTGDLDSVVFFHSAGMGGSNLRKGTDILVRAFQNVIGNVRLVIHSQVGMNRYLNVADLIQKDPRIQFIEGTFPLPGLYQKGDVYVYPSRLEGIGLSVPEALSCGLPVITTDSPPMNEFVQNNKTGFLIEVKEFNQRGDGYYWPESYCSEKSLTELMQIYVDDPSLIIEHSRNARRYALEHLNWEKNSNNFAAQLLNIKKLQLYTKQDINRLKKFERFENNEDRFISTKELEKLAKANFKNGDRKAGIMIMYALIKRDPERFFMRKTWSFLRHYIFYKPGTNG